MSVSPVLDPPSQRGRGVQATFDELGTPLREVTFVVVDLETTGGSSKDESITEVGAVKVRGGEVLGEFQTLVNPGAPIPPFIAVLTGISDAMVAGAPGIATVLPAFLEFARGCVLVAHNAPFDLGFLRAACARTGQQWPDFDHLDTARLARRVLTRDEAPNCRLQTLAQLFRAATPPCHRALADARATVDVLHGLLARVGGLGVQSFEELATFSSQVTLAQRRKRHLAEGLPEAPGVYVFRDARDQPLYVGTSSNLRRRVRNYFVSSENRTRMGEMVGLAERVEAIECATALEAQVRELRLIAAHKPRYNRRSRYPERAVYLKLTREPFPRLSLVRSVAADGAAYLGPFQTRRSAESARTALQEAFGLRQCGGRLSVRRPSPACALAEMSRCPAPCQAAAGQGEDQSAYATRVAAASAAFAGSPRAVVEAVSRRIRLLTEDLRYEDAATHRDRLVAFVRAAARMQRLVGLAAVGELVAARPRIEGGWELHVIRRGRLAAAGVVPAGAHPAPYVEVLLRTAETVSPGPGPTPAASAGEMECVLRWLEQPGVRLVHSDDGWACPARGAGGHGELLAAAEAGRAAADPFADRRGLRPAHRPARPTV